MGIMQTELERNRKMKEKTMDVLVKIRCLCPWVLLVCLAIYHVTFVHMVSTTTQTRLQRHVKPLEMLQSTASTSSITTKFTTTTTTTNKTKATTKTTLQIATTTAEQICIKPEKIVFLKTHKTGSETMAGIFRRYALVNNVSTLLSTRFGGHLYSPNRHHTYDPIHPRHVPIIGQKLPGAHYELVTNHMTYNRNYINAVFGEQAKKITILRNPVTHLQSSWTYYYKLFDSPKWSKVESEARQIMQLYEYLGNPLKFQYQALQQPKHAYRHLLRSQLASFGYHDKVFSQNLGKELVTKWIKEIHDDFDLVLIMEHFDYSLALLCIELCWPIEYAANLKMNEGHHIPVRSKAYHEELIRTVNYPDFMLYEHFNRTFWQKIDSVGLDRVRQIADDITNLSKQLEVDCVAGYHEIKNWNGKMVSEPILRKDKIDDLWCKASVLWGNEQSELLKQKQWQLIRDEKWGEKKKQREI